MPIVERMNRAMRLRAAQALPAPHLEPTLRMLLDAGLVERDGCVFMATQAHSDPEGGLLDRTGREALVNHVRVEDQVPARGARARR